MKVRLYHITLHDQSISHLSAFVFLEIHIFRKILSASFEATVWIINSASPSCKCQCRPETIQVLQYSINYTKFWFMN